MSGAMCERCVALTGAMATALPHDTLQRINLKALPGASTIRGQSELYVCSICKTNWERRNQQGDEDARWSKAPWT